MGGELFDMVIERKHFTEADAASITAAILSVMQHCHSKGIIHRGARRLQHPRRGAYPALCMLLGCQCRRHMRLALGAACVRAGLTCCCTCVRACCSAAPRLLACRPQAGELPAAAGGGAVGGQPSGHRLWAGALCGGRRDLPQVRAHGRPAKGSRNKEPMTGAVCPHLLVALGTGFAVRDRAQQLKPALHPASPALQLRGLLVLRRPRGAAGRVQLRGRCLERGHHLLHHALRSACVPGVGVGWGGGSRCLHAPFGRAAHPGRAEGFALRLATGLLPRPPACRLPALLGLLRPGHLPPHPQQAGGEPSQQGSGRCAGKELGARGVAFLAGWRWARCWRATRCRGARRSAAPAVAPTGVGCPDLPASAPLRAPPLQDFEYQPWHQISAAAKDFVGRLLEKDPARRMGVSQALTHPWITQQAADVPLSTGGWWDGCFCFLHQTQVGRRPLSNDQRILCSPLDSPQAPRLQELCFACPLLHCHATIVVPR